MNRLEQLLMVVRHGVRYTLARAWYRYRSRSGAFVTQLPVVTLPDSGPCWKRVAAASPPHMSAALQQAIITRAEVLASERFSEEMTNGSAAPHFSYMAHDRYAGQDESAQLYWVLELALAVVVAEHGASERYMDCLETRIGRWLRHYGHQQGLPWVDVQAVSVHGWYLMVANQLLRDHGGYQSTETLITWITQLWERVRLEHGYRRWWRHPYARLEQLFLYYAASWLAQHGAPVISSSALARYQRRAGQGIFDGIRRDGSCESHVSNHIRCFADTLVFAKYLEAPLAPHFFEHPKLQHKLTRFAAFFAALIEPVSGELPLFGQSDGTVLALQYGAAAQAETSLLLLGAGFELPVPKRLEHVADTVWLYGFQPSYVDEPPRQGVMHFTEFGLIIYQADSYRAYVKYPRAHTEPTEIDFLHLDLWVAGKQRLCDGGMFASAAMPAIRRGALREANAHNAPLRLGQPFLQQNQKEYYSYWPETRVKHTSQGAWNLTVTNSVGVELRRRIMFEPGRIVIRDRVVDSQPWGVTLNGDLREGRRAMVAELMSCGEISFLNVQSMSISEKTYAQEHGLPQRTYQLLVEPTITSRPVTTILEIAQCEC